MQVPQISFQRYDAASPASLRRLATKLDAAMSDIGFVSVTDLGIDETLLDDVFAASREFFGRDSAQKLSCAFTSLNENFGYQGICEEHLNPGAPADLKETFTMRDVSLRATDNCRWPSARFRDVMHEFYEASVDASCKIQRVLAHALDVDQEFFVQCHQGENIALRLLYYPASGVDNVSDNQLGAGEHTDYGLVTLLFQDDVGGLEVLDASDQWRGVDYVDSAVVVNSGDLLERWSNGRYRSTPHRVQPKIGHRDRYSIALFVDPDSATEVSVLDSCKSADRPALYPSITAGTYIQQQIGAIQTAEFHSRNPDRSMAG